MQTADRRLQTADSVQNADWVQIADCRLQTEYKMQTKTKTVYLTTNDIISIKERKSEIKPQESKQTVNYETTVRFSLQKIRPSTLFLFFLPLTSLFC